MITPTCDVSLIYYANNFERLLAAGTRGWNKQNAPFHTGMTLLVGFERQVSVHQRSREKTSLTRKNMNTGFELGKYKVNQRNDE